MVIGLEVQLSFLNLVEYWVCVCLRLYRTRKEVIKEASWSGGWSKASGGVGNPIMSEELSLENAGFAT